MSLDMTTVFMSTSFLSLGIGLLMLVMGLVHRHHPYLRSVSIMHIIPPIGLFLTPLRGLIPDLFSIVLSNVLIGMWPILIVHAVHGLSGRNFNYVAYSILILIFGIQSFYFTYIDYDTGLRIIGYNTYISISMCMAIYNFAFLGSVPFRALHKRVDILSVIILLSFCLIITTLRTYYTSMEGISENFLEAEGHHVLFVLLMTAGTYPLSVVLMWIWMREIDASLQVQAEELKLAHEKSEALRLEAERTALRDPLTGAGNRRKFALDATGEFERIRRFDHDLSLLVLDIDHFKSINDTFGHARGDDVLVDLTRAVDGLVRNTDRVYRFGGEEFIVMMPETHQHDAFELAERIRKNVADQIKCQDRSVTVSIGLCSYAGPHDSPMAMVERADKLLYQAKQAGRNRVFVAEDAEVRAKSL